MNQWITPKISPVISGRGWNSKFQPVLGDDHERFSYKKQRNHLLQIILNSRLHGWHLYLRKGNQRRRTAVFDYRWKSEIGGSEQ